LTQVELKQAGDEALIKITGDGPLSYRVLSLGSDRVIVDLINTSTNVFEPPSITLILNWKGAP